MSIKYEKRQGDIYAWRRQRVRYMCLHVHDSVELLYARGGDWTVYINFKEYKLKKGDVILVFPGQIHGHEALESENIALLFPKNIQIYNTAFNNYMAKNPVLCDAVDEETDSFFIKAARANDSSMPYSSGTVCGYIYLILGKLLPMYDLVPADKNEISKEEKLITYCSEHYKEPITLSSVAKALNYSPTHLSHLFKNKFQINFTKFITLLRIEDAKMMLRGTNPITEIAFDCGFGSMRTFNQSFKAETGVTPSEYRNRHKK